LHLQLTEGFFEFARELTKQGKKIFLDFKYIDIDDTIKGVISRASDMGIEFVTVYQSPLAVEAAISVRHDGCPKILTVTLLTDRDQNYIREEYGWNGSVSEFVVKKAVIVHAAGGDGVICSPQEIAAIRAAIPDKQFLIVTPGIRPAWSQNAGHKRAATHQEAISYGADYLVVGRPIISAVAPDDAARRIIDEMQCAFDARET
jgi:orotidine-5'-phosphate decarboxylase